jgi:hypothetical protein
LRVRVELYTTKRLAIFGVVTQFDVATGAKMFLADTGAHQKYPSYGFVDFPQNTLILGNATRFRNVGEGDVFVGKVEVAGSESYDTQIGGNTTVPMLKVDSISVYTHVRP